VSQVQVKIKLVGAFRVGRFIEETREFRAGISVQDVIDSLQLPERILGIVLINGEHAEFSSPLKDGDHLTIMPILEGG